MKTKYLITIIACFVLFKVQSQSNLNQFKYVIVPKIFEFSKKTDQYQLNSLTKFLLEKENFQTFFNDESFPEDLSKDRCLALDANVINESGMLKTKLLVEFKDCKNNIVFTTIMGDSKEKEYKKAYHEALRDAFQSFKTINYNYKPKQIKQKIVDVEPVKELKVENPVIKEIPKEEEIVKQKVLEPVVEKPVIKQTTSSNILYAQAKDFGFQVVDSTATVVMILLGTPKQDVFIVKGQDAIVYKEDGFWYISKNATSAETLNLKF